MPFFFQFAFQYVLSLFSLLPQYPLVPFLGKSKFLVESYDLCCNYPLLLYSSSLMSLFKEVKCEKNTRNNLKMKTYPKRSWSSVHEGVIRQIRKGAKLRGVRFKKLAYMSAPRGLQHRFIVQIIFFLPDLCCKWKFFDAFLTWFHPKKHLNLRWFVWICHKTTHQWGGSLN